MGSETNAQQGPEVPKDPKTPKAPEAPERMRWLGGFAIEREGTTLSTTGNRKADALLVYLLSHPQPHPRETLAGMLWDELPQEQALTNLSLSLTALCKEFSTALDTRHQQIAWVGEVNTDVAALIDACENYVLPAQTQPLTPTQLDALAAALSLYQGELLAGFHLQGAAPFMAWMEAERERLEQWAIAGGKVLLEGLLQQQQFAALIDWAHKLLCIDEQQEELHGFLLEGLARSGQLQTALAHYEKLEAQPGVEPGEELAALHRRILHALRRAHTSRPASTLTTPFIGRHKEQQQLHAHLSAPKCRLVTLMGPGGIGKSTLAQHVLAQLSTQGHQGFLQQIVAIRLEGPAGTGALARALLTAFRLQSPPDGDVQALLNASLQDKEMLVFLDGFEDYLGCGGAEWLQVLVDKLPNITWLVTSHEPLSIQGEWLLPLQGLGHKADNKAAEGTDESEALQLFRAAASQHRPDGLSAEELPWANQLCGLVAGMPLALQLAAAWLDRLRCEELVLEVTQGIDLLATQHRQSEPRHQITRALFDRTWARLSQRERDVLSRLSLFVTDFTSEAAQQVAETDRHTLIGLVDKHLLHRTQDDAQGQAYRLHDLLREYAREQWEAQSTDVSVRMAQEAAYGTYYLQALADAARALHGVPPGQSPGQVETLAQLDRAWPHIKAAWRWAVGRARMDLLLGAGAGLYAYTSKRARFAEAYELLDLAKRQLLDIPAPPGLNHTNALPPSLCCDMAMLLLYTSSFAERLLFEEVARHTLERAQALLQGINAPEILKFLNFLRFHYASQSGDEEQIALLLPTLTHTLTTDTAPWLHNAILNELAQEHTRTGAFVLARGRHEEALAHSRQHHDLLSQAIALDKLAALELLTGRLKVARKLFEQSLELATQPDDREGIALATSQLASIDVLQGDFASGREKVNESLLLAEELLKADNLALAHHVRAEIFWALGRHQASAAALEKAIETQRQLSPGVGLLSMQKHRALLCWSQGNYVRGREIATAALAEAEALQLYALCGQLEVVRGWLFRSLHMGQQAQVSFQEAIRWLEQADNPIDLALAYSGWGYVPDVTGSALEQARARFDKGLRIASEHQLLPQLCHVLCELAALTLHTTEAPAAPIGWLEQVLLHPAAWAITRSEIHRLLEQWQPKLSTETLQAATEIAKTPLEATINSLLHQAG